MELKYTPRAIKEIEEESKRPVQDTLADFSMKTILLFVRKGLMISEEEAYKVIEDYLAEGKDTFELYLEITEKLQEGGFLPRKLNLKKVQEEMNRAIEKGV
jgi:hypothetical protein